MRRSDRAITDFAEIVTVMKNCDVCHVAFFDADYPCVVPMNFGMRVEGVVSDLSAKRRKVGQP